MLDMLLWLLGVPNKPSLLMKSDDPFGQSHFAVYYGLLDRLSVTNEWCNQLTIRLKYTPFILACRAHADAAGVHHGVAPNPRGQF